ncbi:MAG: AAA family ATPase [Tissierellia bacterium]|nr:AAA family ATPase [Tissierellia bacterium]
MKILEIYLYEFGAFQRRSLTFTEGINLVMAPNEWGKTTFVDAIDGALYGFLKPYRKVKVYDALYEKYKSGSYRVRLTIEHEGRVYGIERDFYHETCRVFDENGVDVTESMEEEHRIVLPGRTFLKVDSSIYHRYFHMGTREKEDDEALKILEKTMNHGSLHEAILLGEKELQEIGSLRAPTKRRSVLMGEIEEVKDKLRETRNLHEEIHDHRNQLLDLEKRSEELEEKKKALLDKAFEKISVEEQRKETKSKILSTLLMFLLSCMVGVGYYYLYGADLWIFSKLTVSIVLGFFMFIIFLILPESKKEDLADVACEEEDNENQMAIYDALDKVKNDKSFLQGKLTVLEEKMQEVISLRDELILKEDELNALHEEYKITSMAVELLRGVAKDGPSPVIEEITKKASEIYFQITGKNELQITPEFQQYIRRDHSLEDGKFSSGTMEVVNFSIKLAFHLYFSKKDFLLLDDAFVYVDEKRLAKIAELLEEFSDKKQILLFTSNKRVLDIFENRNIIIKEGST